MLYPTRQDYELIAQQTNNPILEWRICSVNNQEFPIFQSEADFYQKMAVKVAGDVFPLPYPTMCWQERLKRVMVHRNEVKLYKKFSSITGKEVICVYEPDSIYKTCELDVWYSDAVDNSNLARDFDTRRSLSEQVNEMIGGAILRPLMGSSNNENCQYNNYIGSSKNCYMCFSCIYSSDCVYCYYVEESSNCFESMHIVQCQQSYNLMYANHCYQCFCAYNLEYCDHCYYSHDLKNCSYCIDCFGLEHKKYCINNEQVSKEDFEIAVTQLRLSYITELQEKNTKIEIIQSEGIIGNVIQQSKNIFFGFDINKCEDVMYSSRVVACKNAMDCYGEWRSEYIYNSVIATLDSYKIGCSVSCFANCKNLWYCYDCSDCEDCFGCIGMKHAKYCILNKQYSKEEYETTVAMIIKTMITDKTRGSMIFDSVHAYNNTIAQELFPLSQEQVLIQGFRWSEYQTPIVGVEKEISGSSLPTISDCGDEILQTIIRCPLSQKLFRISKGELDFYRKFHIELPPYHSDIRHQIKLSYKMQW